MPDPDPQPPKPRAVFPIRWLLLLLPTVFVYSSPMIFLRLEFGSMDIGSILCFILATAVMLCFALGFLLEKWLRGEINSIVWALNYGFMILLGNGVVLFAVCAAFFFPKLR